ncbi:MAG: hypothetical protein WBO13_19285, partial [Vibrio fluvialis]
PTAYQLALVSAWYWIMVLFLAKQIITLYHAAQKSITKDQHALGTISSIQNVLAVGYIYL